MTGGGSGIGFEVARQLGLHGAKVRRARYHRQKFQTRRLSAAACDGRRDSPHEHDTYFIRYT